MLKKHPWIWAFIGFAVVIALAGLFFVGGLVGSNFASSKQASPDAASPSPSSEAPVSEEPSADQPSAEILPHEEEPASMQASDIQRLAAPTAGIDVEVSGEVWQAPDSNCPENDVCIQPPVEGKAAWYGDMPESPYNLERQSTLLFGHADSTFSDVSDLAVGDFFYVTTDIGEFGYMVGSVTTGVYDDLTHRILLGDGDMSLVTYDENNFESTVVLGVLMEEPLM